MKNDTVIVKLLDKDYQVACPEGQQDALRDSADYLDQQMRNIKANGKVIGLERIAVMAALNIANELLMNGPAKNSKAGKAKPISNAQVQKLTNQLDEALNRFSQLEI